MAVSFHKDDGRAFVRISGDVDLISMNDLQETLFSLVSEKINIELDMSDAGYLDSSGIGLILLVKKKQKESGNYLKIVKISDNIRKVLTAGTVESLLL